ncbi:hypothetical protein F2Q69_00007969 [Brassica cretica]|uniref:Uncharacterized protein n=1 Tax=Brassica cretica TaxID=69181 RepID=A0A8S9P9K3_BRACR|nr:hypothetical protein F2Q69_00007969 [Brassica cretica]
MVVTRAKNPNPIIREIPATIRSIDVCTLIPIILLIYLLSTTIKMCSRKEEKPFAFDTFY